MTFLWFVFWSSVYRADGSDIQPEEHAPRQTIFLDGEPLYTRRRDSAERRHAGGMDEALRQTVLIAARDELGCITRDHWLGESVPESEDCFQFRLTRGERTIDGITLTLQRIAPSGEPGMNRTGQIPGKLPCDSRQFIRRLERLETASRHELVTLLREFGIDGKPNPWHESAAVPEEIAALLKEPTFTSQFAAVRALHRLLRENGESPERLAALVEGYLHLAYLTEDYLHPMHEVFKIRAVLYAHRLTKKRKPLVRYGRGISFAARALAGFHDCALNTWRSRLNRNPSEPVWLDLAEPCLEYDLKTLEKYRKNPAFGPWAKLYELRTHKYGLTGLRAEERYKAVMEEYPLCHAVRNAPVMHPDLKFLDLQTAASAHLGRHLYDQIGRLPDLPEPVALLVPKGQALKKAGGTADSQAEHALREELIALLTATDGCGSPTNDPEELSWQVLGSMVRELSFSQVIWRAVVLRYVGPDADVNKANRWIDDTDILTRGHRFRPFLDAYGDEVKRKSAVERIPGKEDEFLRLLYRVNRSDFPIWLFVYDLLPGDNVWIVLSRTSHGGMGEGVTVHDAFNNAVVSYYTQRPKLSRMHGVRWMVVSPFSPWALYYLLEAGDSESRSIVESHWESYGEFPEVQLALGLALHKHGEYRKAIARLEALRSKSPTYTLYDALAKSYRDLDDVDGLCRTADAYCKLPDASEGSKAVLQLRAALELLAGRDRKSAVERLGPVADGDHSEQRLAKSFLLELRGQFDEAARAVSPSPRWATETYLDWFWAKARTKEGVDEEARKGLRSHLERCKQMVRTGSRDHQKLGLRYMIALTTSDVAEDRAEIAAARRSKREEEPDESYCLMFYFLVSPAGDGGPHGNRELQSLVARTRQPITLATTKRVHSLASYILRDLEDGKGGDLNTAQLEDLIAEADLSDRAYLLYFVGAYCNRYGQVDRAVEYWKRTVALPLVRNDGRNLAIYELRKRGMTDDEYRKLMNSWFEEKE